MKILIINTFDKNGGAARAAFRLHESLLERGLESQMLVQYKTSDDYTVLDPTTKTKKVLDRLRPFLDQFPVTRYKERSETFFSPNWLPSCGIVNKINEIRPDIVHLHWINGGMINIKDLSKIKAPIVWSLHDMWAFTGGCHYDENCGAFKNRCGNCKVLRSHRNIDLSRLIWSHKKKSYSKIKNITINCLSSWLKEAALSSSLLKEYNITNLPNPINIEIFKPINKEIARKIWNLPVEKKLIMFGAMGATSDPRKGFNELRKAITKLDKNEDLEFVIFGSSKPEHAFDFGFNTHYVGRLAEDTSLVTLYNAADVIIVPSLQENLSNVIMESLACGTPVVAFDVGGNSDMIEHNINGYLAEPFQSKDLAKGIEVCLRNRNVFSKNARLKVLNNFSNDAVVHKYISLYKDIKAKA
ncbi:MAG: glycosyltransferase family 4 protein [Bacteroidales bacterium]|jgi:glycosyltransferase involved in cell wall biosynthesis|nr:glycosyltransferase family 4 protein [Bacteroidales bacterium]